MGKINAKKKGKRGERELVNILKPYFEDGDVYRGDQSNGARECDVENPFFWLEAKRQQREEWRKWMKKAVEDRDAAGDDRPPIVVSRKNGEEWCVLMRFEDFLSFFLG